MKLAGAIVLAGGYSRRMGTDKALLQVGGRSLLEGVCNVASSLAETSAVVTPWPTRYQHLSLSCQFVHEPDESQELEPDDFGGARGPLAGFARGLSLVMGQGTIADGWVLLLACDLPRLEPDSLLTELDELAELDERVIAYLHPNLKGWEPLCGFYRTDCLDSIQAHLKKGGRSFQGWLAAQTVAPWKRNNPQLFFNCNTPEDFQKISVSKSATSL